MGRKTDRGDSASCSQNLASMEGQGSWGGGIEISLQQGEPLLGQELLSALYLLPHLISQPLWKLQIIILLLHLWKLRLRKVEGLPQSHRAGRWWHWDLTQCHWRASFFHSIQDSSEVPLFCTDAGWAAQGETGRSQASIGCIFSQMTWASRHALLLAEARKREPQWLLCLACFPS